jgi:hypothetical protein
LRLKHRHIAYTLSAVLLGLVLGGCGGGSEGETAAPDRVDARQATTPVPTDASGGRPAPDESRARPPKPRLPEPRVPLPTGEAELPAVTTRAWTGTASLQLVGGGGPVRKFEGPVSGDLPGEVSARLKLEVPSSSGTFVAELPGGTVEGILKVVTSLAGSELRYSGTATTTRGTERYERLTPTTLTVTGTSSQRGIRMRFSGDLRY